MTPEQLQAQIDEDYAMISYYESLFDEDCEEMIDTLYSAISSNERKLALMTGKLHEGQIIALTDKNTVSLFN